MNTLKQRANDATRYGFNHVEAYCVMLYATTTGSEREIIWNSRDGVTPFIVFSRSGHEMQHVAWEQDTMWLTYVPDVGSRIFVDLTRELALPIAQSQVEQPWDAGEYPMKDYYPSKEEAVEMLLTGWMERPGAPHIMEVTPEMHEHFKLLSAEWQHAINTLPHHRLNEFKPDLKRGERILRIKQQAQERRERRQAKLRPNSK